MTLINVVTMDPVVGSVGDGMGAAENSIGIVASPVTLTRRSRRLGAMAKMLQQPQLIP